MTSLEHRVALVRDGCSQHSEHRDLSGFVRKIEIVTAIDHQNGLLDVRDEVDGIGFRRDRPRFESSRQKHAGPDARLDRQIDRRELRAEADAVKRDARPIDVRSRLEIIDGSPNVLASLDADLAKKALT